MEQREYISNGSVECIPVRWTEMLMGENVKYKRNGKLNVKLWKSIQGRLTVFKWMRLISKVLLCIFYFWLKLIQIFVLTMTNKIIQQMNKKLITCFYMFQFGSLCVEGSLKLWFCIALEKSMKTFYGQIFLILKS